MVCRCTSPYTASPLVCMYEQIAYERGLPVIVDRFSRFLDMGILSNDDIKVDVDFCCTAFPFDKI